MSLVLQQVQKFCHLCGGSKTTRNKRGCENWYNKPYGKDKQICQTCYGRLFVDPKYRSTHKEQINMRRRAYVKHVIRFLGQGQLSVSFRQLTGYCSRCPNNVHDGSCKVTNMHHWIYIIIFPWFGREELCVGCHMKTRIGMKYKPRT